jgi:zinc transport system ATP-binding protein
MPSRSQLSLPTTDRSEPDMPATEIMTQPSLGSRDRNDRAGTNAMPSIDSQKRAPDANAPPLVSARGLEIVKGGRVILHDVTIEVRPAEIVTLIGPNGAGKTTLARVLLGLERPARGDITRHPELRVGYAPQRFDVDATIPLSVRRFMMLGTGIDQAELGPVLDEVGAGGLADRQLSRLSGGEFQRVLLARALLRKPNLLVLDEPVRGVDYMGEAELYKLIGDIRTRRGCGILLISHDLHVVMSASDRVVCVNQHVCCQGVPETVAQHPEYQRLFGMEAARSFALYRHAHDHSHDLDGGVAGEHSHVGHDHHGHSHDHHGHDHAPAHGQKPKGKS